MKLLLILVYSREDRGGWGILSEGFEFDLCRIMILEKGWRCVDGIALHSSKTSSWQRSFLKGRVIKKKNLYPK